MSFRVVIPARYASTRLPGKPLLPLAGRPLIAHVHDCAVASGAAEILVATDDPRIAEACEGFGASVVMTSSTHRSGSERLAEVATTRGWSDDDIVVNLQGDEPLTPPAIIRQVAEDLTHFPEASVSTLCAPIHSAAQLNDPHTVKVVRDAAGYALYFSRAPIPWERDVIGAEAKETPIGWRHVGMYAYRAGYLRRYVTLPACELESIEKLEQLRVLWHGARIHVAEAVEVPGHGVDTPEDLKLVAALMAQKTGSMTHPE
ncbi:3-deoxy-manno-octulosonate cytidylyltransferase [Acidihalobacter yilgarnensis]|uniref:3-deoxy-manno-octulosonate cytidylyltransferase n=1 Tax=Acidihalobacter yilgarnensis TaxID=2819280 RepID=A0A1D8INM1_9GAMM|nr:3-deoxy-manno-octulosonate cytidylyltransferase [Acidihalobacter yilgarnensis]AOU98024.1 3-deoxy-manno-octulosonate cytidylyltransferase [Acidihalobacter yilgarnensis]